MTEGRGRRCISNADTGVGRGAAEQQDPIHELLKNAPERDDIPAFIPPFDHDGPPTEECDVPRARRIGIQRWLSWQMLLSKENEKRKEKGRGVSGGEETPRGCVAVGEMCTTDLHAVARHRTDRVSDLREDG